MLFLGTEKYPTENAYQSYLEQHGGASNAFTAHENTCFYFDIQHAHLHGALDRFAQFFLAPLFTASATDREMKAVDSENSKNLQSDNWRLKCRRRHSNPVPCTLYHLPCVYRVRCTLYHLPCAIYAAPYAHESHPSATPIFVLLACSALLCALCSRLKDQRST